MVALSTLVRDLYRTVLDGMPTTELPALLAPAPHSVLIKRRRAMLVLSRVRLVAVFFAILTPLWIPVDVAVFTNKLAGYLAMLRIVTTLAFVALCLNTRPDDEEARRARWAILSLMLIPTVFFLVSQWLVSGYPLVDGLQQLVGASYGFLPFVMVAGLSIFPLAAVETVSLSLPVLLSFLGVGLMGFRILPAAAHLGALWLLVLLVAVATLSGMSQLHFLIRSISQASRDGLTRIYNRPVGEEMLIQHFAQCGRAGWPMAVAFVDIDDFKSVNDHYGHEEGDKVLRIAAASLQRPLRSSDILIRWGGEEFVAVMPATDLAGACVAFRRLRDLGLGARPDGRPITVSVGIAERLADGVSTWSELVEKSDQRMYVAKQLGKDRLISSDGLPIFGETRV